MAAALSPWPDWEPPYATTTFHSSAAHAARARRGAPRWRHPADHYRSARAVRNSDVAAAQLVKKKLARWIDVVDGSLAWKEKSGQAIGLVITDLGRAALEAIETEIADLGPAASKIGHVIERLRSPEGISLAEMSLATGWQPHSARAALTTLRKKGFRIDRAPDDGGSGSRYWIAEEVAQ